MKRFGVCKGHNSAGKEVRQRAKEDNHRPSLRHAPFSGSRFQLRLPHLTQLDKSMLNPDHMTRVFH